MTIPNLKSFRLIDFHPSDEFMAVEVNAGNVRGPPHGKEKRKKEFVIQMFGVNEKRETCCLFVRNYQPFFFIHVGDDWTETDAQKFKQHLKNMLIKSRDESSAESILSVTLIDRAPLYGFAAGRTSKFVDIRFANLAAFNRTKALWYGKDRFGNRCKKALGYEGYSLDLYESNLPPLLRFFHVGEISPSGWVEFDLDKVEEIDISRLPPVTTSIRLIVGIWFLCWIRIRQFRIKSRVLILKPRVVMEISRFRSKLIAN